MQDYLSKLPTQDPYVLAIYGAIVLTGLVNCFMGQRIFRYALGVILALGGAVGAWELAGELEVNSQLYLFAGIGLGALLGLLVSFVFVKVAGAVAGALLAYALLSKNLGGLEPLPYIAALVGGCAAGAVLGLFLANPVIVLAMAFVGAFQVVYGSLFFIDGTQLLILGDDPAQGWELLSARRIPFIVMMALGTLGAFVQFRSRRRRAEAE
jgi:hypothetical protein